MKRARKRGKDMRKLRRILTMLTEDVELPARLRDHPLKGEWRGWRDLHLEPDWLLIYRTGPDTVHFGRTGTHADLFRE